MKTAALPTVRINSFYRIAIWAPIVVPAVVYVLGTTVAAVLGPEAVTPAFGILPAAS
jgi:hypothetical protein